MSLVENSLGVLAAIGLYGAPVTATGDVLECNTKNKMLQTVGKTLQSVTPALLSIWAIGTLSIAYEKTILDIGKYIGVVDTGYGVANTGFGLAGLVLSMPLISQLAKSLGSKERIENFQRTYFTAIKCINISTAVFALGYLTLYLLEKREFIPALQVSALVSTSLISSIYTFRKNAQASASANSSQ